MNYLVVILGLCLFFGGYRADSSDSSDSDSDSDADSSQVDPVPTTPSPAPSPCICQQIYLPVCTVGGDEFANQCELDCFIAELQKKLDGLQVSQCKQNSGNMLGRK